MTSRSVSIVAHSVWLGCFIAVCVLAICGQYEAAYYLTFPWQLVGFVALVSSGAANKAKEA